MNATIEKAKRILIAAPSFNEDEWQALREPLANGWLTQGPKVAAFEKAFATRHQVNHALAVTSCTTGLHLALTALGVGPGDEVIIPAFTWIATANVVLYCGATPIFCDVDRDTFNIDLNELPKKISKKTKAIIPVHLFGLSADIDKIRTMIPPKIKILEDAACAAGGSYKRKAIGSLGDMAVFSFHPRKSITTGEGGMITTNNPELAKCAEIMRNHGAEISEEVRHNSPKPYLLPDFKVLGFNYRMTDLQAAIGLVQLKKLDSFIQERQTWADYYKQELQLVDWLRPQKIPEYCSQHAWQAFVCYVDPKKSPLSRNKIMDLLQQKGIATRPGTHAVHRLSFYKNKYGIEDQDFPAAKDCDQNTMAIPLHNKMQPDDFHYIVNAIKNI